MVYVLNIDGQPLMPTERHGKVRRLLKNQQAKVIKRCPFTIQLLYETSNNTQTVTLGVDTGYKKYWVICNYFKESFVRSRSNASYRYCR